jgi:hypothetical protein
LNGVTARVPVLRDIDFSAAREGDDAKPGNGVIPKERPVFARGALQGIN